jgi:hypothetical protein
MRGQLLLAYTASGICQQAKSRSNKDLASFALLEPSHNNSWNIPYSQLGITTITVDPFPTCILLIRQRRHNDARVSVRLHTSQKTEVAPCEVLVSQLINAVNHENHCMLCQQLMKVCHQIIICSRDRTQIVQAIIDE